jgi:hypothetical protein
MSSPLYFFSLLMQLIVCIKVYRVFAEGSQNDALSCEKFVFNDSKWRYNGAVSY